MTLSLQRTVLALLATSALSACATQTEPLRPNFPVRSPDAAPQAPPPAAAPAPPRGEDAPLSQANPAPVESRPLDTLPRATPPAAQAPPPRAQPTYRTVTTRSVTGRVVDADGRATTYEVQKGDSLIAIARKLDTTVDQLREDNGIEGSNIRPGQKLKGPTTAAKAYVVASGDTLFAIARRFGVTADALAEENDLSRNATIRTGQRLRLPEGFRDRGPIETTTRVTVEGAPAETAPALRPAPPADRTAPPSPSPSAAAEPAYRTVTTRSVTGRVVDVEGKPVTYEVKRGDNLTEIARKLDTTVEQLRKDNNIKGSNIQPGQDLKGPRSTAKAYVAGSGDTLDQIARRFSVTAAALRSENGLSRNATIGAGQRIRLPEGFRDRGPITSTSRVPVERSAQPAPAPVVDSPAPASPPVRTPPPEPAPVLPSRPQPYTPSPGVRPPPPAETRPAPPPVTRPTPPPVSQPAPSPLSPGAPPPAGRPQVTDVAPSSAVSDAQISQLGRGRFIWPLQGDVISAFGPKPGNQRNDGINIRARAGDPIRAAAAGDVVYAGDQVPGFGNLVLIKHEDGWVTAYGHLSRIDVKMTQKVTQGQQVGQAGSTGGVAEPQLHFEVRYAPSPLDRARPIDPRLVLPR